MATLTTIREALATALEAVDGVNQVNAYPRADPSPPAIQVMPGAPFREYDQTFGRGSDDWTLVIEVFVPGAAGDIGSQKALDAIIEQIKGAVESDKTLGGTVDNARVTEATDYGQYVLANNTDVFGCKFTVEILASN